MFDWVLLSTFRTCAKIWSFGSYLCRNIEYSTKQHCILQAQKWASSIFLLFSFFFLTVNFLATTAASIFTINLTRFFFKLHSPQTPCLACLCPLALTSSSRNGRRRGPHFLEPDPGLLSGSVQEVCCIQIMGILDYDGPGTPNKPRKSNFHFHSVPVGSINAAGLLIFLKWIHVCYSYNA